MTKKINSRIRSMIEAQGQKFQSVTFIKANGSVRRMQIQYATTGAVSPKALKANAKDNDHMLVYDVHAQGLRMIDLNTVLYTKSNGRSKEFRRAKWDGAGISINPSSLETV